ncbi:MAG: hypothetical protein EB127_26900 [Alphaproteobacteria bacterium]|nr:hypothetical protein [Alphaproteobacteria bacterium]
MAQDNNNNNNNNKEVTTQEAMTPEGTTQKVMTQEEITQHNKVIKDLINTKKIHDKGQTMKAKLNAAQQDELEALKITDGEAEKVKTDKSNKLKEYRDILIANEKLNFMISQLPLPPKWKDKYSPLMSKFDKCKNFADGVTKLNNNLKECGKLLAKDIENEGYKKDRKISGYLKDFGAWVGASTNLVGAYITKAKNSDEYTKAIKASNETSEKARMYSPKREKWLQSAQKELQSAQKELQSAQKELQSAQKELQSAQEALQSKKFASQKQQVIQSLAEISNAQLKDTSNQKNVTPGGVPLLGMTNSSPASSQKRRGVRYTRS